MIVVKGGKLAILTDVDGVLTDGRVRLDAEGRESKTICYRDLDAMGAARRAGVEIAFAIGEDTEMARFLAKRFGVDRAYFGAKDKLAALNEFAVATGLILERLVYIGDSDRDAPALAAAGLGLAPLDATPKARMAANLVLESPGGKGVLLEAVNGLMDGHIKFP